MGLGQAGQQGGRPVPLRLLGGRQRLLLRRRVSGTAEKAVFHRLPVTTWKALKFRHQGNSTPSTAKPPLLPSVDFFLYPSELLFLLYFFCVYIVIFKIRSSSLLCHFTS